MPPKRKNNLKQKQKQNQRQTVVVHVHTTKPAARRRRTNIGKTQQSRGNNFINVQPSLAVMTNPIPQMYSPQTQPNSLEQLGISQPLKASATIASSPIASSPVSVFQPIHRPIAIHPLHGTTIENLNNTLSSAMERRNLTLSPVVAPDDDDKEVASFSRSSSPLHAFDLPFDSSADIEQHVERAPAMDVQNVPVQEVLTQENPANNNSGFTEFLHNWNDRIHKSSAKKPAAKVDDEANFEEPVKYSNPGNHSIHPSVKQPRKTRSDKGMLRGAYGPRITADKKKVAFEDGYEAEFDN